MLIVTKLQSKEGQSPQECQVIQQSVQVGELNKCLTNCPKMPTQKFKVTRINQRTKIGFQMYQQVTRVRVQVLHKPEPFSMQTVQYTSRIQTMGQ